MSQYNSGAHTAKEGPGAEDEKREDAPVESPKPDEQAAQEGTGEGDEHQPAVTTLYDAESGSCITFNSHLTGLT